MFYDHRILTQRKYGVATVWLVATIGSKSSLSKKVQKKEILEVNLSKACQTIVQSENPLALRLQSNLLFGVSRVFFEQYNYLFSDVTHAHQKLSKEIFIQLDTGKIDLIGTRTRPETLVLQDDPTFIPELTFILPEFTRFPEDQLHNTTQFTIDDSHVFTRERLSIDGRNSPLLQLIIPESSSFGEDLMGIPNSLINDSYSSMPAGDYLDDVDFIFDENGELQDLPPQSQAIASTDFEKANTHRQMSAGIQGIEHDEWQDQQAIVEKVSREHQEGKQSLEEHDNLVPFEDSQYEKDPWTDRKIAEAAEPFPSSPQRLTKEPQFSVPLRRQRKPLVIRADNVIELRTSELAAFGSNYLGNMEEARQKKNGSQMFHTAKKAAIEFVYGWNGMLRPKMLQSQFDGKNIIHQLYPEEANQVEGKSIPGRGRKRSASKIEVDEPDSEGSQRGRRIRDGPSSDQFNVEMDDMGDLNYGFDDQGLEVGRMGSPILDANTKPWDLPQRGSRAGSVLSFGGFGTSSVGAIPSSTNRKFSSASRRFPSPAIGSVRGRLTGVGATTMTRAPSSPNNNAVPNLDLSDDQFYSEPGHFDDIMSENQRGIIQDYSGQGAVEDGKNSQILDQNLEGESYRFLEFFHAQWENKYAQKITESTESQFLAFDEIVNPRYSSSAVAAQAFHHVLNLATRGAIRVKQKQCFNQIILWLPN